VLDIDAILSPDLEHADGTIMAVLEQLNRNDVPTAAERVRLALGDCR
jgi:hypothetical protein